MDSAEISWDVIVTDGYTYDFKLMLALKKGFVESREHGVLVEWLVQPIKLVREDGCQLVVLETLLDLLLVHWVKPLETWDLDHF